MSFFPFCLEKIKKTPDRSRLSRKNLCNDDDPRMREAKELSHLAWLGGTQASKEEGKGGRENLRFSPSLPSLFSARHAGYRPLMATEFFPFVQKN